MKILVINAGSSSLKYQLFDTDTKDVLAKGLCERIGLDGNVKHSVPGQEDFVKEMPMKDHGAAIRIVIELLTQGNTAVLTSLSEIDAVGHRVLHGGAEFTESVIVDDRVIDAIRKCIPLGPLHNPANLTGILACSEVMEGIPQVAVFDTAFHQTMPEKAYLYALPYEYYEKHGVRRYGFHGTSHRYVSQKAAEIVGKPAEDLKIIVCHLGNGSSISAVNGGKCIDTSMGLTPLEGVPMGTRSGCIDPAILEFIMNAESIDISEMTDILNKKSGVLGISGISSDFRDLDEAKDNGHKRAIIALECFAYSVKKYIGAYVAALGGLDILVFTAGIGENNYKARKEITSGLEFMGISIDDEKNINNQTDISAEGSRVRTLVVPTNEELAIAIDTMALVEKLVK
ncbi:MAG: acetate kinase [Clostridiales bacterium]|nr:acetate kinase [Clostridiales bacterium]